MPSRTVEVPPARTSPPRSLVDGGAYAFGTYDGPIANIDPLAVAGSSRVTRFRRNLGLKEWEAFQLGDDDVFVLGAVYDAKVLGLLQVLVVDKSHATIERFETKVPSARLSVARGLSGTTSHGHAGGFTITLGNDLADGRLTVDASHPGRRGGPGLELHGTGRCGPGEAGHLVIIHPFDAPPGVGGGERALYSHKAMMPFDGTLRIGGDDRGLASDRGFLILDDHHGDYPRPMRYDWLTGVRRNAEGVVEGFNLTRNQIRDPEVNNENAIWIGDAVHRLPAITIDRPSGPMGPWHAHDRSGAVDVRFTPTVESTMHVGPRHALAEYYAPYGWFEGTIEVPDARLDVDGFFGVGEQKRISV
jgi:hypothetical protein